jgi:transcriptional regulator with XRE-family HTH domain
MNKRDPEFDKRLGGRIRDVRTRYQWSQRKLAQKMRMSQDNVSRYERGQYALSVSQLVHLSNIFRITIDSWLVDDETWQNFVRQL